VVDRDPGVEFAGIIQKGAPQKKEVNIYIILNRLSLLIIGASVGKPSPACGNALELDPAGRFMTISSMGCSATKVLVTKNLRLELAIHQKMASSLV